MRKKFYKVKCDFLLIGSISGRKKDVIQFVESQIEKYSNIPNNCKYYIKKAGNDFFHFEIQENPSSGRILDQIIKDLDELDEMEASGDSKDEKAVVGSVSTDLDDASHKDVLIYDFNDIQYQVYKRTDGSLRTFVRSHDDVFLPPMDGIEDFKGSSMGFVSFFSKLEVAKYVFGGFLGLSLVAAMIATSAIITKKMVEEGYENAIQDSPISLIARKDSNSSLYMEENRNLPSFGGLAEIKKFKDTNPGKVIGKLIYNGTSWKAVESESKDTPL